MRYTTEDFPIKLEYWYVVNFKNFSTLTLYPVYFINKESAKRAIKLNIGIRNSYKYKTLKGVKLRKYSLTYTINLGRLKKFNKYDTPPNLTRQQKKTRRTVIRRRLRRMGMLMPKKHKLFFKDNVKGIKIMENKQKVADCPNTDARAFRLERMPKKYHFIILEKEKAKKNGLAFKVKSIRYNRKTGVYKKVLLNIYKKDVIIPYLLTEIFRMAKNNEKVDYGEFKKYCLNKGIRIYKTSNKAIL